MNWIPIILYRKKSSGSVDELGNPIAGDPEEIFNGTGRFTPWSNVLLQITDREVTKSEQLIAIPTDYDAVKSADIAVVDGVKYLITNKYNRSPRWVVMQVKVYERE
ncbi:MAG: hypothetical protein SOW94_08175 [Erysipelotrichaceae bacterium]|nr:hypothetical protein [Erysipelotrichaceae bacterium]